MSRSAEQWQSQQEQENESGIDMHDCYHYHHPLKKEVEEVRKSDFQEFVNSHEEDNDRYNECAKAPF
jgi:hypothetical protein